MLHTDVILCTSKYEFFIQTKYEELQKVMAEREKEMDKMKEAAYQKILPLDQELRKVIYYMIFGHFQQKTINHQYKRKLVFFVKFYNQFMFLTQDLPHQYQNLDL